MLEQLKSLFDAYTLNARVKPVLIIIFPMFSIILIWFPETRDSYNTVITLIISFGILSLFSNYFATVGRKKEILLFHKMGGNPATTLLRHNDNTIDKLTKNRYHSFLSGRLSTTFPSIEDEKGNSELTDEVYDSAIRYLRNFSRDNVKYPLVFKENMNYGFARNLYSSKLFGVTITIISLILFLFRFYIKYVKVNQFHIIFNDIAILDTLLSLLVVFPMLIIWIFFINIDWVKERAFAYARALLEICEGSES